jgi:hypothetical protein
MPRNLRWFGDAIVFIFEEIKTAGGTPALQKRAPRLFAWRAFLIFGCASDLF